MKDKTHNMNMGLSKEDADRGYGDPGGTQFGQYMTRRQYKHDQLKGVGLDKVLVPFEDKEVEGTGMGGFLPRNNTSDRF